MGVGRGFRIRFYNWDVFDILGWSVFGKGYLFFVLCIIGYLVVFLVYFSYDN